MFDHHARSITTAALLSAVLATIPFTARAETPSVVVHASDLNLATNAGRTVLQNRIALAVEKVCDPVHGRTPWETRAYTACRKTARASAASQFDVMLANFGKKVAVESTTAASAR
ncbi:MAG TPA: UrcA family protein [Rhizomicrobium sp.]|nr:UrcA family protein [Rhizomicrobium sp.]